VYLEIDEGFLTHPKTLRFCGRMQDPNAVAYLLRLWTWAARSCPTGELAGMEPYEIEIAVQYRLLDGKCYAAMAAAGFIDEEETGAPSRIHGWMERTGGAIKRMAEEAARKKLYRAHRDNECPEGCELCAKGVPQNERRTGDRRTVDVPADSPRTNPGQSADATQDKPTQTRPVQSRQDKTSPDKPSLSEKDSCAETAPPSSPPVLVFPVDGGDGSWGVSEAMLAEHQAAFPALDVRGEYRRALAWVNAAPGNRKTAKGMPRFLFGWLSRAQNGGAGRQRAGPSRGVQVGHVRVDAGHEYPEGEQQL